MPTRDTAVLPVVQHAELLAEATRAVDPASAPLLPWQSAFAEWLSSQSARVSVQVQRKIASSLAHTLVSARVLGKLRRNHRFMAYLASLQLDNIRRTRAFVEEHYMEGVDAHFSGLRMALEANDHKSIPSYTVPILDRVVPKKDAVQANTQINVTLSSKQAAMIDSDLGEISFEVVAPPVAEIS